MQSCPTGQCCDGEASVASCPDGCCQRDGTCGDCLVFVTSTTSKGALGGLDGANDRCRNLATTTGLPGFYKAWLSTSNVLSPATRFVKSTTPHALVDGATHVADNWNDLVDNSLDHAIDMDQT